MSLNRKRSNNRNVVNGAYCLLLFIFLVLPLVIVAEELTEKIVGPPDRTKRILYELWVLGKYILKCRSFAGSLYSDRQSEEVSSINPWFGTQDGTVDWTALPRSTLNSGLLFLSFLLHSSITSPPYCLMDSQTTGCRKINSRSRRIKIIHIVSILTTQFIPHFELAEEAIRKEAN